MDETHEHDDQQGARDRILVEPPLDPSDVAFLAGFAGPERSRATVLRVWPGQPRRPSPWLPCESGCCLALHRSGAGLPPGLAPEWLRFLVGTFLGARHRVHGQLVVRVRGGPPEVLLAEGQEVFAGAADPVVGPSGGAPGGWPA